MWSTDLLHSTQSNILLIIMITLAGGAITASSDINLSPPVHAVINADKASETAAAYHRLAIARADAITGIHPEMSSAMRSFHEKYRFPGHPVPVFVGDSLAAWIVPLYDAGEIFGDNIIISANDGAVLSVPGRRAATGRFKKNSISSKKSNPINLMESFFNLPTPGITLPPDLPQSVEIAGDFRVLGCAIDPEKSGAVMISGWNIPPASMHETAGAIERINATYHPDPPWRSVRGLRQTPFKCLFYAASFASNIMGQRAGRNIGSYVSLYHGEVEQGMDPRILESLYENSAAHKAQDAFAPPLLFRDLITRSRIACNPRFMASVLCSDAPAKVDDPALAGLVHHVPQWTKSLFTGFCDIRPDEASLRRAIDEDRIVIGGWTHRVFGIPLYVSTHFSLIAGYLDVAGMTYLVFAEPYGDYPPQVPEDAYGGPMWRALPFGYLGEAVILEGGK